MEDTKGTTTMTWEELEDCGVSVIGCMLSISNKLSPAVSMNTPPRFHKVHIKSAVNVSLVIPRSEPYIVRIGKCDTVTTLLIDIATLQSKHQN